MADFGVIPRISYPETPAKQQALAYALTCVLEKQTNRPLWGAIGYNVQKMIGYFQNEISAIEFQTLIFTTVTVFSK